MLFWLFEANRLLLEALKFIMVSDGVVIALILFLAIGLLPVFVRELRNNVRILLAYWFVIALHQSVAFTNAFLFPTLGATSDASRFHFLGAALAQSVDFFFSAKEIFYVNMLGVAYWLLGSSKFLGSQLSILMFAVSCVVLIKILDLMELSRYKVLILFAFGTLPSMVFFGSVTLRESYQILFFMLAVYYCIKTHMKGERKFNLLLMVVSLMLLCSFHSVFPIYSAFMLILFMVWTPYPASSWLSVKKRHLILVFSLLTLFVGVIIITEVGISDLGRFSVMMGNPFESAADFRGRQLVSRATYGISLDGSSLFSTACTSFLIYVHYLFAPFPWQVKNVLDVYASMESILRMILIFFSVKHWRSAYGVKRRLLGLMLILFFSMSFMWALGTTNYGTAARHNLLSWWILLIVGVPSLMGMLSRFWFGLIVNRRSHSLEDRRRMES